MRFLVAELSLLLSSGVSVVPLLVSFVFIVSAGHSHGVPVGMKPQLIRG